MVEVIGRVEVRRGVVGEFRAGVEDVDALGGEEVRDPAVLVGQAIASVAIGEARGHGHHVEQDAVLGGIARERAKLLLPPIPRSRRKSQSYHWTLPLASPFISD